MQLNKNIAHSPPENAKKQKYPLLSIVSCKSDFIRVKGLQNIKNLFGETKYKIEKPYNKNQYGIYKKVFPFI